MKSLICLVKKEGKCTHTHTQKKKKKKKEKEEQSIYIYIYQAYARLAAHVKDVLAVGNQGRVVKVSPAALAHLTGTLH